MGLVTVIEHLRYNCNVEIGQEYIIAEDDTPNIIIEDNEFYVQTHTSNGKEIDEITISIGCNTQEETITKANSLLDYFDIAISRINNDFFEQGGSHSIMGSESVNGISVSLNVNDSGRMHADRYYVTSKLKSHDYYQ